MSGLSFFYTLRKNGLKHPDVLEEISPKDSEVRSITVNAAQMMPEDMDPVTNPSLLILDSFEKGSSVDAQSVNVVRIAQVCLCLY